MAVGNGHLWPEDHAAYKVSELPWMKELLLLLQDLQYGSITLVVQDGKVIQMDRVEKIRIR
jgi:hypothetical protein